MAVKLNLAVEIVPTGRAVCDTCSRSMVYTGTIRTEGMALTNPDRRQDGGGPIPLTCPWCQKGVLRYQK